MKLGSNGLGGLVSFCHELFSCPDLIRVHFRATAAMLAATGSGFDARAGAPDDGAVFHMGDDCEEDGLHLTILGGGVAVF